MTKRESLTFDQCRQLKEWGYPQEAEKYISNYGHISNGYERRDKLYDKTVIFYAVPTIEGMMEWLRRGGEEWRVSLTVNNEAWVAMFSTSELAGISAEADSPLLALYKLAEQAPEDV